MDISQNWFTRFEQKDVRPSYLENMRAATEYFMEWFVIGDDYLGMLTHMHRLATRRGYSGFTNTRGPIVPIDSAFRGVNREAWRPLLKKDWFKDINVYMTGKIKPCLAAIDLQGSHWLVDRQQGYELHLPHENRVLDYLAQLAKLMDILRSEFDAKIMANYVQTFVVGHPFERVNYSVCMAQVNAMLWHYGYKTFFHGYFDFDCFMYDYPRIEKIFQAKLEKR